MGIAVLGTLMSNQAIGVLAHAATDHGIANASAISRQAVMHHSFPDTLPALSLLYISAMESDFHVAMVCASLNCIVALVLQADLYTKLGHAVATTFFVGSVSSGRTGGGDTFVRGATVPATQGICTMWD